MDTGNGSRWRWDPLEREGVPTKNRRHRIRGLPPYGPDPVWQSAATDAIARTRQVADQSRQKSLNRAGLSCA